MWENRRLEGLDLEVIVWMNSKFRGRSIFVGKVYFVLFSAGFPRGKGEFSFSSSKSIGFWTVCEDLF